MLQWSKLRILSNLFLFLFLYPCFPFGSGFFEFTEFHRQWIKPLGNWFSKKCIFFLFFFFCVCNSLSLFLFFRCVGSDNIVFRILLLLFCCWHEIEWRKRNAMKSDIRWALLFYFSFLFILHVFVEQVRLCMMRHTNKPSISICHYHAQHVIRASIYIYSQWIFY